MRYTIEEIIKNKHSPFLTKRFAEARILVVDDIDTNVKLICSILESAGFKHTATAADGVIALEKTHHFKPDLVLLDIMMPNLDGFGYCRQIRSDPLAVRMPIIVQTALDDREDRLQALSCGADDFLNKPLDSEELILRVLVHLERYFMFLDMNEIRIKLNTELEQTKRALWQFEEGKVLPSPRTILNKHYESLASIATEPEKYKRRIKYDRLPVAPSAKKEQSSDLVKTSAAQDDTAEQPS